ncbi:MAG TPA: Calx-beta domain-containing protein, partial [Myxococcota bacterium]
MSIRSLVFTPARTLTLATVVTLLGAASAHATGLSQISIGDVTQVEGDSGVTHFLFTVALDTPAVGPVSVDYATSDVEAVAGSDYVSDSETLVILDGESAGTIDIAVNGDLLDEDDETFLVTLTNPQGNAALLVDTALGTISNDDAAHAPTVSIAGGSITEADANLTFTVTLSAAAGRDIDVDVATHDGTAVSSAGGDFSAVATTLHFHDGDTSQIVDVAIHDDLFQELDEAFTVVLSNPVHASLGTATATGTIHDDGDAAPVISVFGQSFNEGVGTAQIAVQLDVASGKTVTVKLDTQTVAGGASSNDFTDIAATTMTFAPGTTVQTIGVLINDDDIDEDDEAFKVHLSAASNATIDAGHTDALITILDNDAPPVVSVTGGSTTESSAGGTADDVDFVVALDHPSAFSIDVTVDTRDGTAVGSTTNGGDYDSLSGGTVTFAPGETSHTVAIDSNDDDINEADEDFFLDVSSPTSGRATLSTAASGCPAGTTCAEGIIHDDDPAPVLSINDVAASEGTGSNGTAAFTVTLTGATAQTVTVQFATAGAPGSGTATSGTDFTATSGVLTFTPGQTTKTIAVPLIGDALDEDNETFTVTLSSPTAATISDGTGIGTINDDDNPPSVSVGAASVSEGDSGTATLSFPITLSAASGKSVTVTASTSDGTARQPADYAQRSGSVTVPAGSISGHFDVSVNGDVVFENDETLTLTLGSPVNASLGTSSATGTIVNDDAEPVLSIADATLAAEGNTGAKNLSFTVSLTNPTDQIVTFDFATSDGTATAGSDYVAASSSSTIPALQTSSVINVVVLADTLNEPNETFHVTLNKPTSSVLGRSDAIGTIVDDDAPPTVAVVQPVNPITEGDAGTQPLHFSVVLNTATGQTVTVHVQTQDDTAIANPGGPPGQDDYVAIPDTVLTFAPGTTVIPVDVNVKGDELDEADQEQFKLVISNPSNAALGNAIG